MDKKVLTTTETAIVADSGHFTTDECIVNVSRPEKTASMMFRAGHLNCAYISIGANDLDKLITALTSARLSLQS